MQELSDEEKEAIANASDEVIDQAINEAVEETMAD
jgi:hypothetical protein